MIVFATQGERLDELVYRVHNNLDHLEKVLEDNKHLRIKLFLDEGDEVTLPEIEEKKIIIEDELW